MSDPHTPLPALTQPQREAVFDFLLLGTYADSSLKLRETERLFEIMSGLGWDSTRDLSEYADFATAHVREASETPSATRKFLADLAARLESEEAKIFALALLTPLLSVDGPVDEAEESFYSRAKVAFGV